METNTDRDGAAHALTLIAASRVEVADRLLTPRWYYPGVGLLVGGMISSQAISSNLVTGLLLIPFVLGLLVLDRACRSRTGFSIEVFTHPATRPWNLAFWFLLVLITVSAVLSSIKFGWVAVPITLGVLTVPLFIYAGRRFEAMLRADLRGCQCGAESDRLHDAHRSRP